MGGRKIVVISKHDQGKPDLARTALAQAYEDDGAAAPGAPGVQTGATLAAEEYAPAATTDFTALGQRLFDTLNDRPGKKLIWFVWAGASNPLAKLADIDPCRYGGIYGRAEADTGEGGVVVRYAQGRMTFRNEDHQALQTMCAFKIRLDDKLACGVPELTRETGAGEHTD